MRHIFAVACSLDSQIVGEPDVLGQVKAAHRLSVAAGTTGTELEAVLQAAFAAAKRVRSETAIAERPTSIAAAALQIARDLHGAFAQLGLESNLTMNRRNGFYAMIERIRLLAQQLLA